MEDDAPSPTYERLSEDNINIWLNPVSFHSLEVQLDVKGAI